MRQNLVFLEAGEGTTLDHLPEDVSSRLGRAIVRSGVRMLLKQGRFDADRHRGNFLFDVGKKEIQLIDFGQFFEFQRRKAPWRWDDTTLVATFLRGIHDRNSGDVARMLVEMSNSPDRDPSDLAEDLQTFFANPLKSVSDLVVGALTASADRGLEVHEKFAFGAMKGLLVLSGENYVPPEEFRVLLGDEVASALRRKAPALLGDKVMRAATRPIARGEEDTRGRQSAQVSVGEGTERSAKRTLEGRGLT